MDIFTQIGIGIVAGALIAALGTFIKQPAILGYILAGILLGPSVFGVIQDPELINTVSHIGIMLLLFLIGLEMGVEKLKDMGLVSLAAGLGQVIFTGLVGYGIASALGFPMIQSMYIAVALTFSSTVIAVKIMSEKQDMGSLHGQISVGILIVQDLLAIMALLVLGGFGPGSFSFDPTVFGSLFLKGILLAIGAAILIKTVVGRFFRQIADSSELLILCAIAWCFFVAIIGKKIGFSMEIGAFIAGISLANIPYAAEISAKTRVIRDFFVTIFFIALGAGMIFEDISSLIVPFLVFSAFVLVGNAVIIMIIMRLMRYDIRTGLLTGLNMANISEFSLIVIALGASLGHIDQKITALITLICVGTMTISSYMITYGNHIYGFLKTFLAPFDVKRKREHNMHDKGGHIVVIGYGDSGQEITRHLRKQGLPVVVVEHNNSILKQLQKEKIPAVFGSIEEEEVLSAAKLHEARLLISTLSQYEDTIHLLHHLSKMADDERPVCLVTAMTGRQGLTYFNAGADYVVVRPHVGAKILIDASMDILATKDTQITHAPVLSPDAEKDVDYARFVDHLSTMRLNEILSASKSQKEFDKK